MILSLIIFGIILIIIALLFVLSMKNSAQLNKNNKSHCYMFSIEGDDIGIYVISNNKLSEDEINEHKTQVLNKLYDKQIPENVVIGVVYMGLMNTEE